MQVVTDKSNNASNLVIFKVITKRWSYGFNFKEFKMLSNNKFQMSKLAIKYS